MRNGPFEHVDEPDIRENHDLPVEIGIFDRLADGAEGDVVGDEVVEIALRVVPVRKARQFAARRTDVVDMLAEFVRFAQLDGEVSDDRKRVEVDGRERGGVVGAGQLERRGVGKDFQSVGSMR